jgi:hypothetical protein
MSNEKIGIFGVKEVSVDNKEKKKGKLLKNFRSGNVSISIFKNSAEEENGKAFNFITFAMQRSYIKSKNPDNSINWSSEKINFRKSDLIKVETILNEAKKYLYTELKGYTSAEEEEEH